VRRSLCAIAALATILLALPAIAGAAAPTGVTAIALDGRVDLAWTPSGTSSSYAVYRGTSPTAITTRVSPPGGLFTTSYSDATAVDGTTYYYAVREVISGFEGGDSNVAQARPVARRCSSGNPIVLENCYPGASTWNVRNTRTVPDAGIEGYAAAQSIDRGESVALKVSTSAATTFDVEVWRMGDYAGAGARLLSTMVGLPGTAQPACTKDATTGLVDCASWSTSTTLSTTASWPTGMYLLRLVRKDNGADYHVLLAVRDDARRADLVFGSGFTTFEAYNDYGGKSLYDWNSIGSTTVSGTTRAVKVSFDRPFEQPRTLQHDWFTVIEAPFVSWLERMGYDVAYQSDTDLERDPSRILNAGAYVSPAHDEYWSVGMRSAAEQARDAGHPLLFSGGNEVYWKVRFESSPVTGRPLRIQACYKSTQSGPADPSGIPTGTWRDPAGANRPENALAGQMYVGDKDTGSFPLVVTAAQGADRVYRNTSIAGSSGSTTLGTSIVGWEWDARVNNGAEPAGVKTLSSSPVNGNVLQDAGRVYAPGSAVVSMAKYTAPSGALVLSTGTNHWWRGLGTNFRGEGEPLLALQQVTANVLADMGARPATPAAGIVLDPAPPTGPPTVSQTAPASGATAVAPLARPSATFTQDMDPATITASSFTLAPAAGGPAVSATVAYDASSRVATLTPGAALAASSSYTATLSTAVKNSVGTALAAPVSWTFTTAAPDTTAPTVSISAPAAGATVAGQVTVSATAADDVGVAGVQFRLDGNDLGAEDTSAPYSASWDTAAGANGLHTLTAVAHDGAGNPATAPPVTVTVDNRPVDPSGLVGAWSFDDASATTLADASNQHNDGAISGATRTTAGRFGGALSFDGVNDRVTVPASASLDLAGAATVEAWVYPTALSSWSTAVLRERPGDLAYALYANTDTDRPSGHVFTSADTDTRGAAKLALNAWTHLALTYDGATLRLYVNGALASSRSVSGAIRTSSSPLSFGGNGVWGEWLQGRLDEVRVYARALSATEVAADRDTPIGAQAPPDAQPPTAPGTLTATGQLGRASLSWGAASDDVGVTEYRVYRSQTAGFAPGAANQVATVASGTSYVDSGLAAGTWRYRVAAADAAGNLGPASNEASATVTADTTAPSVSVTAPAAGASVTGTVTVSATAADDVGVASVQMRLDGADLGALDTASPYTMSWDTRTIPNGSHALTAVARDAAGNATTSAPVAVTVSNAPGSVGLVAAYGFEEASGTTALDGSGAANHGTLEGATRVATGRLGRALSFNGTTNDVLVPDAASLDLTNGMTLEAWVNPTVLSNWRTVLIKEQAGDLVYALYANTDTNRPSGHVFVGADRDTRGTAKLALNAWTHLAATYDGATLRLYVNGVQASTRAIAGAMAPSTGPLRIGGNAVWGEWFSGLIDEVRVYNRALTAAQVQADMTTPVGP
jgi:hypothetical protein